MVPKEWTEHFEPTNGFNVGFVLLTRKAGKVVGHYDVCTHDCLSDHENLEQVGYFKTSMVKTALMSSTQSCYGPNAKEMEGCTFHSGYVYGTTLKSESIGGPLLRGKAIKYHYA